MSDSECLNHQAYINIQYPGYFRAYNWRIELFVNGKHVHQLQFWQAKDLMLEVPAGEVELKARMIIWWSKLKLIAHPGEHYKVSLTWNWFTGFIKLRCLK